MRFLHKVSAIAALLPAGWTSGQDTLSVPLLPDEEFSSRPKVAIMEVSVALDGESRPELGRSCADTLIAGFLRAGTVDVIDAGSRLGNTNPVSAVEAARQATCELLYVPTLVGQGNFYRMTVRKLLIPSGKVEQIHEETTTGGPGSLFELAERMVLRLNPGRSKTNPMVGGTVKGWMSGPTDVDLALAEAPMALPATAAPPVRAVAPVPAARRGHRFGAGRISAEVVPAPAPPLRTILFNGTRRYEIEQVGRVSVVNRDYSFCVVDPQRSRSLKSGDRVLIEGQGWSRPTVSGRVTRLESKHAVVEYDPSGAPPLRDGAVVYEWVPEAETQPSQDIQAIPEPVPLQ